MFIFLAALALASQARSAGMPDFYSEPGINPNRDYANQLYGETIDPFTGALQLTYTDIFIPGNGGFDLKIQRAYNSALVNPNTPSHQSVMGVGWTFHMGRVTTNTPYADGEICPTPHQAPTTLYLNCRMAASNNYFSSVQTPPIT